MSRFKKFMCTWASVCMVLQPVMVQAQNNTLRVPLGTIQTGAEGGGQLTYSDTEVNFGAVPVNTALVRTVTIENTGTASITLNKVEVSGTNFARQFTSCGEFIAPGASCEVKVSLLPTSSGAKTGSLVVESDDTEPVHTISLTGRGRAGTLSSPGHVFPEPRQVNDTVVFQDVTVTNSSVAPVVVSHVGVSMGETDFNQNNNCLRTLAANDSCTVRVSFKPTEAGTRQGVISVVSDSDESPLNFSVQGEGRNPAGTLTAASFGTVQVADTEGRSMTVSNTGVGPLTITNKAVSGADYVKPADGQDACTAPVPVGGSCTFLVNFTPTATGPRSGTVTVETDAGTLSQPLDGVGAGQSATLSDVTFGNRDAGNNYALDATLTNKGVGPLSITVPTAASVTGAGFTFGSTNCGATLPKGSSCTVSVQYSPTTAGDDTGSLKMTTGAGVLSSTLTGKGEQAILAFAPTTVPGFGNVQVGETTLSPTVTLTNSGNVPASGLAINPPTGYSVAGSTCGTTLAAGASCTFKVQFAPTEVKAYSGSMTVTGTAPFKGASLSLDGQGVAQSATLSNVAFGNRAANSSTTLTATLTNTGVGPLNVTVPTASSVTGTGFSFVSTTCATSVAANGTCTVSVRYVPTNGDAYNGELTVITGAGTKKAVLSGQGLQGVAFATPSPLNFAATQIGQPRVQAITLSNTGNTPLEVSGISVATGVDDYKQTNGCATIPAGGSCSISVTFTPTAAGSRSGSIAILHDGAGATVVNLTGTGQGQSATLSTPAFSTTTPVGSSSTAQATLTNTGVGPLAVTTPAAASVTGTDFSFVSTTCGSSVAMGDSCVVTVRFSPTATTERTGALSFATGAGTQTVTLKATGIQGFATINPASLTFAAQQTNTTSAGQTVTVRNTGTHALVISKVETTAGSDFAQTNTCGTLAVNDTCTVSVTFTPTAAGTRSGTLTFTHNGSGATSVSLTGTGRVPSVAMTAPTFANTQVGANTTGVATLTNDGVGSVTVTAPTASSVTGAEYQFVSTTCGGTLTAGNSCATTIRFAPTGAGVRSGSFSIATSAGSPSASLTGTGLQGNVNATATTLTFPAKQIGESATQSVTVTNNGNTTLTFSDIKVTAGTDDYTVSHNCAAVAVSSTCKIDVTFNPSTTGSRPGTVTATHNGTGPSVISLTGTGQAPSASLSTPTFPATPVGSSNNATATLTNTGIGALAVTVPTAASVSGTDFSFVSTTCGTSIAAGNSCSVTVQFTSTSTTPRTGQLSINTSAGAKVVSLGSTGIQGYASISPGSLTFAATQVDTTAATQTVTVTNTGTDTLVLSAVDVSVGKPEFLQNNNCASVPVNGTCTVTVNFTPNQAGPRSGTLSFVHNGGGMAHVSLSGTGQAASGSISTPSFPTTGVGNSNTATATVTNTGIGVLTLDAPTVSGTDFSLASTTCGASLVANGTCTVTVRFSPTSTAARTGTVSINSRAGMLSAQLNATGVLGTATLNPNGLAFADRTMYTTSGAQTVTVTNTGSATLVISAVSVSTGVSDYGASNGCGGASGTLAPGNSCTISVAFTPQAAGPRPGTLTVTHNGTNGSTSIALQGSGVATAAVSSASFSPATVTAGGSSTFSWSTSNAASASVACTGVATGSGSGTSGSITVTTSGVGAGSCQVTAYNATGTPATGSASLTTVAAPTAATATFAKSTVTAGGSTTFSWTTSNASSATVSCSGVVSGSGSGTSGTINVSTSGVGAGSCQVVAANAAGMTSTKSASLTTVAAATVSSSFSTTAVTAGATPTFSWSSTGATGGSVSCSSAASGTGTGTSGSIGVSTSGSGTGYCTATVNNAAGDSVSSTSSVTVYAAPRVTSFYFSPTSVGSGGASTLYWSTSNATSASISCTSPASGSSTALNGSMTVYTSGSGTGRCSISVSNGQGGSDSSSANLSVVVPAPTVTKASFSSYSLLRNGSTTFSWTTSGATSASVSCSGAATGSGSGTSGSITVTANSTGNGTCAVTASNAGGSSSASDTFTAYNAPTASASFNYSQVAPGGTNRFNWSSTNATSGSVSCWGSASGSGSGTSGGINTSTSGTSTGYCQVTVSNPAGSSSATASYSVLSPPSVSVSFSKYNPRVGETVTFSWSITGSTTSANVACWGAASGGRDGNLSSGSISVRVVDTGNGPCNVAAINAAGQTNGTDWFTAVAAPPPPSVTSASFSPSSISQGGSGSFSWSTSNATSASVSCSGAGASASGSGTSGSISVYAPSTGTVTCSVTARNSDGATASGSGSMSVTSATPPPINANINFEQNVQEDMFEYVCYGNSYESGPYPAWQSGPVVIGGCRSDWNSCNREFNSQFNTLYRQCEIDLKYRRPF